MRFKRSTSRSAIPRARRCGSARSLVRLSTDWMNPEITVSGVRNSWLMVAANCFWLAAERRSRSTMRLNSSRIGSSSTGALSVGSVAPSKEFSSIAARSWLSLRTGWKIRRALMISTDPVSRIKSNSAPSLIRLWVFTAGMAYTGRRYTKCPVCRPPGSFIAFAATAS